jgi:glycerol-3-phosphate acyltransferase PlsY
MTPGMTIGALLAGSYLFGSLPFGLWIAKQWKGVDIRSLGSGNIGSTNVWRVCGPTAGLLAFTFDLLKGLLPPLIGLKLGLASQWQILAALCGILGHNYSVWLGFKGGKGIATSCGALLGVAPPVGLTGLGIFLLALFTLRWVSLGSILAALSVPLLMLLYYPGDTYRLAFGIVACAMALYKHRANIQRLRAGTEPKVLLPWTRAGNRQQATGNREIPTPNPQPPAPGTHDNAAR